MSSFILIVEHLSFKTTKGICLITKMHVYFHITIIVVSRKSPFCPAKLDVQQKPSAYILPVRTYTSEYELVCKVIVRRRGAYLLLMFCKGRRTTSGSAKQCQQFSKSSKRFWPVSHTIPRLLYNKLSLNTEFIGHSHANPLPPGPQS